MGPTPLHSRQTKIVCYEFFDGFKNLTVILAYAADLDKIIVYTATWMVRTWLSMEFVRGP